MRESLFRGKRSDTGEWIEGYYCRAFRWEGDKNPVPAIQEADCYLFREAIPETVGQFTGLFDKNGVRIWENDIVIIGGNKSFPTVVEFLSGSWQCVRKYTNKGREKEYSYLHRLEYDNPNKYEVIGNRFDNPDLLN